MPPKAARKKSKKKPLKIKSTKRRSHTASYVLTSVGMVLLASLIIFSGIVYKRLNTVFASADSAESKNFEEQDIFTVLIASADDIKSATPYVKHLKLIILDKKDLEISVINFDTQKEYEVAGKFGKEKAFNLLALANSANEDTKVADEFFAKLIENNLKFKIDRYILVNDSENSSVSSVFSASGDSRLVVLIKDFAINNLAGQLRTNMTDRELYSIFEFLSREPVTNTKSEQEYPKFIQDVVFNSNIAEEKFMISILNGAQIIGAATYASDVVNLAGGRVTFVGNAKNDYTESIIVTDNPQAQTVKYLKDFFKVEKVETKSKYGFIESDVERSDVTLILGLDFTKNIY